MSAYSTTAHNYISRFDTITGSCHIYHDNIILFSSHELSQMIFSGLLHELRTHTKHPQMFSNICSAPSKYKLPTHIDADKLIDEIRTNLASCLIFIHTWISERLILNEGDLSMKCEHLLNCRFDTYESFFDSAFSLIIGAEKEVNIKDVACSLRSSVGRIYRYLGIFNGNMAESVYKTENVITCISALAILSIAQYNPI